jgi:hypothetical protein
VPHINLPPIEKWDGSKPAHTPELVLLLCEHRANEHYRAPQAASNLLLAALGEHHQARGVVLSWEDLKCEFLCLAGAQYSRDSHDALSALAHNVIHQTSKQSVTEYRLAFDARLCEVGHSLPDTLLVQWFVQGLSASCALCR